MDFPPHVLPELLDGLTVLADDRFGEVALDEGLEGGGT